MLLGALAMDSFPKQRLLERHFGYSCLILPFICPEGVVFHSAKLYFSISASRGLLSDGFLSITQPLSFCAATAFSDGIFIISILCSAKSYNVLSFCVACSLHINPLSMSPFRAAAGLNVFQARTASQVAGVRHSATPNSVPATWP